MTKKYKCGSIYSITIVFKNGHRKHISFDECGRGRSEYITSDEEEQEILESRSDFNRMYTCEVLQEEKQEQPKAAAVETKAEIEEVQISDLASAKEYLAERFEVTRTSIRTKTAILQCAKDHNIKFIGLE